MPEPNPGQKWNVFYACFVEMTMSDYLIFVSGGINKY